MKPARRPTDFDVATASETGAELAKVPPAEMTEVQARGAYDEAWAEHRRLHPPVDQAVPADASSQPKTAEPSLLEETNDRVKFMSVMLGTMGIDAVFVASAGGTVWGGRELLDAVKPHVGPWGVILEGMDWVFNLSAFGTTIRFVQVEFMKSWKRLGGGQ